VLKDGGEGVLYGRKVRGTPEVVLTPPSEGLRGLVELDSEKFARYKAMVTGTLP
jgi:hypothetical protein